MSTPPLDQSAWQLMRRLVREGLRPHFGRLAAAISCMVVVAATTAASAWLLDPVVNEVFVAKDRTMLWPVGLAVIATFAVKSLATYGQASMMAFVAQRILADMQKRLFAHLTRMDLAYFNATNTGQLISRLTHDVSLMRYALTHGLTGLGKDALSIVFLVGVMFYQDWMLASVSFLAFPLAIRPIARLAKRMRRVSASGQAQVGELTTALEQSFQGIRVIKSYRMEEYEQRKVGGVVEELFRLVTKAANTRAKSSPTMEGLAGLAVTIVIVYGGHRVIEGATTPGAFFSFIAALLMAAQPMKALANTSTALQEGFAATQRVFDVLDTQATIVDKPDARDLPDGGGAVRFEEVSFSYGDVMALNGVSLEVRPGQTVALVGPSGGGKSTVLNLIPRFYDVGAGRVLVDGVDVRDATLDSLRGKVALVNQEITLFDDTVRANIAYGRFGADDAEIEAAARAAAAHEFIMALPQGYDTYVGERGLKLSGGQRQRLAIARAMLKNAPILLLDEATSALDTESERLVQAALERLMTGRTTLVVAHRLSTVVNADLICVIDAGRIVERGTHAELLARQGLYAKLHALQFNDPQPAGAA